MNVDTALSLLIETNLAVDESALLALIAALPPTWHVRAERYKPFEARVRSAVGYTLLMRILREAYGFESLPAIGADEHGKPFLVDCPLYFSISHCKAAVACIVASQPVGLDVQDILRDMSPALAARIAATPHVEATPIHTKDEPLSARELTVLWTQKEASAKLDGRGLKIGLEHLPLPEHKLITQEYEDFLLCVAREG